MMTRSTLVSTNIPGLDNLYRGKVRDNYDLADGTRIIIATDRLSAFDRPICAVPEKGNILTQTAKFWFNATRDICPNHVLSWPDPNVLIAKKLRIFPVEIIVRDYLAGTTSTSLLQMYKSGERTLYGIDFPDGLEDNEFLPETVITPTTKSDDHDKPLSYEDVIARGLMTGEQWDQIQDYALQLFWRGRQIANAGGLILVDTKYEFGLDENDNIILADEIHTPDSSRYWYEATYPLAFSEGVAPPSFDKDVIRRWVCERCDPYKDPIPTIPEEMIERTTSVYIDAYRRITDLSFMRTDLGDFPSIHSRICANLRAKGII